jgi:hypothetical protein
MRVLSLLLMACTLSGCAELPDIDRLRCGNGLVEPQANEDCDGLPAGSPLACGQAGSEHACLLICDDTPCPSGWACGIDAVCRAPSGHFEPVESMIIAGDQLELGHLDGDPYLDLVTLNRGALQFAFGQANGGFVEPRTVAVPSVDLPLVVADLEGDGDDDILLFSERTVLVFEGDPQREIAPLITPEAGPDNAIRATAVIYTTPPYTHHDVLTFRQGRLSLLDHPLDNTGLAGLNLMGRPVNHIAVGDFDDDHAEDEIALATIGGRDVHLVRVVCSVGGDDCQVQKVRTVPTPEDFVLAQNGTHFGDIDGDGTLDLVVALENDTRSIVAVSYQGPDGLGPLLEAPALADAAGCTDCSVRAADLSGLQLVADLTGDGRAELITAQNILRIDDAPPGLTELYHNDRPMTGLGTTDFNGDGQLDLYGEVASSLAFILSHGERFTRFSAPTTINHDTFTVGDFDGDRRPDVAFQHPSGALQVLFNGPRGLPSELVTVGQLNQVLPTFIAAQLESPATNQVDAADDLIALRPGEIYRFFGGGNRLPRTLITLPSNAHAIAVGRWTGGEPHLLIDGQLSGDQPDVASMAAGAQLTSDAFETIPIETCGPSNASKRLSLEVESPTGPSAFLSMDVQSGSGNTSTTIRLMHLDDDHWRCDWTDTLETNLLPSRLLTFDLDRDGHQDIVAVLTSAETLASLTGEKASMIALWRGTDEGFARAITFTLPFARSAALVTLDHRHGQRLVLSLDGQLAACALNSAGRMVLTELGEVPTSTLALRAGDIDGDGVEDLVAKTLRSALYYRQRPCSARDAWVGHCSRPAQ